MQQRRTPGARGRATSGTGSVSGSRAAARRETGNPRAAGGPRSGGRSGATRGGSANGAARGGGEPARSAARPAAARRAAASGAARRTRAPHPSRLTGRATVLGIMLIGLLLAYAYPVRVYLSQQAEISALQAQQRAQLRHIDQLAEERAKWNDDEYIKAQARRRLHYVLPGEVPYVVLDDAAAKRNPGTEVPARSKDTGPWYGKLWSSIQAADRPAQ